MTELVDVLEKLEKRLEVIERLEKYLQRKRYTDQTYLVGNTQSNLYLDYKGYHHLYMLSASALTIDLKDAGHLSVPAQTWTCIDSKESLQIFTVNQATAIPVVVRATDDVIAVTGVVSSVNQQGLLTLTGSLSASQDNLITFSGNGSVAKRLLIQNISSATQYGIDFDTAASTGSFQLPAPAANTVSMLDIAVQCATLHIWVPMGGNTGLNAAGGLVVMAWA